MTTDKRVPVTFHSAALLLAIDLIGTFVFAVEGAMAAVQSSLDILGLMVLAFATSLGGGIIRDVLIGAVPPNSIRDWRYPAAAFAGGAVVFFQSSFVNRVPESLIVRLDAAGLALFAVAGAAKALDFNIHPLLATLMGGITGVGGGTIRDVLLACIPSVLRADVYAAAALAGAAATILDASGHRNDHRYRRLLHPAHAGCASALEPAQGRQSLSRTYISMVTPEEFACSCA
jgi:uncharacterized membrane protein YeiH